MPDLAGKVALVTGGSTGIGRAACIALASAGAKVIAFARREKELHETIAAIESSGGRAIAVVGDVTKAADVEAAVNRGVAAFGRLDLAFNNAGIEGDPYVPVAKYSEATWRDVIDINLTGVFLCLKYELPHLVETRGAVVNMASVAGLVGGRLGAAYYASKHGVVGLTKAAALEYAARGVRINAVAPGVIPSAMTERLGFHSGEVKDRVLALHPLGRYGTDTEVVNAVLWLLSPAASFTTGHVLPVDGGFVVP
jgi:NAD(P)-dependent dehydrogenase (short-subunit alcohol dehydrogenase family)